MQKHRFKYPRIQQLKLKYAKTSVQISENSTINKSLSEIKVGLKRDDENIFT